MCKTTWAALYVMNWSHANLCSFDETYSNGWKVRDKKEAASYLFYLCSFEFIISVTSSSTLLHPIAGIPKKCEVML